MNRPLPHPVAGILFDLDGTLIDSLSDLANAMNASLAEAGFPTHAADDYRYFVGDGLEHLARRSSPPGACDDPAVMARLIAGQRKYYHDCWNRDTRPYDGIPALLAACAARGLALAVLSNKPDDFTKRIVATFFPDTRFAEVRGARADMPKKPDPAGAVALARDVGIPPEQWLYLGDTNTDMKTANGAGMFPLGAAWGFRPERELWDAGAAAVFAKPADLCATLSAAVQGH